MWNSRKQGTLIVSFWGWGQTREKEKGYTLHRVTHYLCLIIMMISFLAIDGWLQFHPTLNLYANIYQFFFFFFLLLVPSLTLLLMNLTRSMSRDIKEKSFTLFVPSVTLFQDANTQLALCMISSPFSMITVVAL